jgi:hypothetical protein
MILLRLSVRRRELSRYRVRRRVIGQRFNYHASRIDFYRHRRAEPETSMLLDPTAFYSNAGVSCTG